MGKMVSFQLRADTLPRVYMRSWVIAQDGFSIRFSHSFLGGLSLLSIRLSQV